MFHCAGFLFSKFVSSKYDDIKKLLYKKKKRKKKLYKLLIAGINPIYNLLILKLHVYSSVTFHLSHCLNGIMVNTFCRV